MTKTSIETPEKGIPELCIVQRVCYTSLATTGNGLIV